MRVVLQRVDNASVEFDNTKNSIDKGLLVLLGVTNDDTENDIDYLIKKISNLRIFEDEDNKMNYSVQDIKGSILLVSNFTLYANTKKGNRPSFTNSMSYEDAKKMYELFIEKFKETNIPIKTGEFGADMKITLTNDGPVTIIIDSKEDNL
ncbi:MAG: D-tyrosyl-tRNA(Tyr) deacylase [Bacilli bacterium]|nr:D-tyrosyl-tRNA(Tyr) deacylase [Bacilli bacterium]